MNDDAVPSSPAPSDGTPNPAPGVPPLPTPASEPASNVAPAAPAAALTPVKAAPTLFCVSHRKVPAVFRCDRCGACVCATCVFELPGSRHLCPTCTSAGSKVFSRSRSHSVYWSLGLASVATLALVLLVFVAAAAMASAGGEFLYGVMLNLFVLVPAMVGLALAWGAHEKRLSNPATLWVGLFWNAAIAALFFLLVIIGLFAG